ncbi:hypothetical protein CXU17_13200 [Akkermansia muciniphila]|nr:hypothetical protein CXU17_13200 [Akkermansia muciniphila]
MLAGCPDAERKPLVPGRNGLFRAGRTLSFEEGVRGAVLSVSIRLTGLFLPLAQWFFLTGKFVGKAGCPLRFQEGLFPLHSVAGK